MSFAGFAAAKEYAERKQADFYHNLAKAAEERMYENAKKTLKIFKGE